MVPNIGVVNIKRDFSKGVYLWHPTQQGARRVTTEDGFTEASREGWTEKYRQQDYPKMMHHVIPTLSKEVNSEDEEQALLEQGYEYSPAAFTEKKAVEAKIAATKAELRELEKKDRLLADTSMKKAV
jgi:hypothetical protein